MSIKGICLAFCATCYTNIEYKNLSVFPIIGINNLDNLITFHQAINNKSLEVSEISDQASVPSLNVHNKNVMPVFIIDGQTITVKN